MGNRAIITPQVVLMTREGILKPWVGTKAEAYVQLGIVHKSPSFLQIETVLRIREGQDSLEGAQRWK